MDQPIVQGLLTFLGGAVVAGLNALLSARLLDKKPAAFASFSAVRRNDKKSKSAAADKKGEDLNG